MTKQCKLPSGATLEVRVAPLDDAIDLHKAILREASSHDIDMNMQIDAQDASAIMAKIPKLVMGVASSKEVTETAMRCLGRCTINGHKVTKETFEDENLRGDYYPAIIECVKANIAPFIKGLVQALKAQQQKPAEAQK